MNDGLMIVPFMNILTRGTIYMCSVLATHTISISGQ
jgi:hypothetical protein